MYFIFWYTLQLFFFLLIFFYKLSLYIQFLSINEIAFLLPLITLFSTYSYTLLTMIAFDIHFREFREKLDLNVKLNKLKMTKQYLNLSGLH